MYKLCIVIPVYNHHRFIENTVDELLPYGYDLFLVDDGSIKECHDVLRGLAERHPNIRLLRLEANQGKGAAVLHGMHAARKQGYTHALQIDADGQHDSEDIPPFVERSRQHPHKVVSGCPVYDASIPKGRLYGRYITHFWVWVETLSLSIRDSMCGFRVYPLEPVCRLATSRKLKTRMDFDTEVLVRLYWRGVETDFIDTRVSYPRDGISHFRMVRDNWHITCMHTHLFFGMLLRLPVLLCRKWRRA